MQGGDCYEAGEEQRRQDDNTEVGAALFSADVEWCSFSILLLLQLPYYQLRLFLLLLAL